MAFIVGFGRRTRRLAAAAAACAALATAGCATQGTGLGLTLIPRRQVVQMSQQSWEQLLAKQPRSGNAAYRRTARRVADRLLTAVGEIPSRWQVVVFKSDEVNAFALPNRKIGVYEGMMKLAGNDAELAAVIGHEIGHVEKNHGVERVNSQAVTQLGIDLVSAALGSTGGSDPKTIAALLGAGARYGLLLPYSRNQESQADLYGLDAMAAAGYDPRAAIVLWQKMLAKQGGRQPPVFMSDHPGTGQRIQRLQAAMPQALAIYRRARS